MRLRSPTTLIDIDGIQVKQDIVTEKFACDLSKCAGRCCFVGDAGPPVTTGEVSNIEANYPRIKTYMQATGVQAVEKHGISYRDFDDDLVLTLIGHKECAFAYVENGIYKCAIETAWFNKHSNFRKPLSCHLYPIVQEHGKENDKLIYERNSICEAGRKLGRMKGISLYRFLREALERAYGKEWFEKLEYAAKNLKSH